MDVEKTDDILRPLTFEEVDELFELYKNKYGKHNFHYLLMYNQCKWHRQLEEIGAGRAPKDDKWVSFRKSFYTHRNCDFRKYGTYVSLHFDLMQSISFHSWEPDFKELFECLNKTKLIDWKSGPLITNVDLIYCEQIKEIANSKGATVKRARTCQALVLPHEKALKLQLQSLPIGYKFDKLRLEHAALIHEIWVNNKEGSLEYIKGLIKVNKTLGIYEEPNNELVAWIFQNDFSGLGILQVMPKQQRQGFGSLLASYLSKKIADSEEVAVTAWILTENFKSEGLLTKIGFEKTVINEWIQLNKSV
ncbi:uncharacterized protein LOC119670597 [Teleopsis dalmanni]|uniref:uncharacterized protein LOC119670597 n=1 Tax=Teleopsis dalmanni TaxID=139649 RepID=UPI0018CD92BF|nr:uncharacterized protein LOC119670597 [Teleopsis dalmanni]